MDTIVALATPAGTSAIAVIRCSGDLSRPLFLALSRKNDVSCSMLYHFDYFSIDGGKIDDVMGVFFEEGHSYTGESSFEIYCHGNMVISDKILADLCSRGCRIALGGEYTKRAFLNGKLDLSQAEAVADIIHASNERALSIAQKQLGGVLSERINEISRRLLDILAELEFVIDFSDDELSENNDVPAKIDDGLACVISDLDSLIASNRFHKALESGLDVVILGAPNAGKSSLLNFLLDDDRAIVDGTAGTTRDVISENVTIGNERIKIFDTAGIRDGDICDVEKTGIRKAIAISEAADIFLIIVDASSKTLPELPENVLSRITADNAIVIANKSDLPSTCCVENFLPDVDHIHVSITTGKNMDVLKKMIASVVRKNYSMCDGVDIVVNRRHVEILIRAREMVVSALDGIKKCMSAEFIASDIRQSVDILGDITGKCDNEAVLDRVFANFCVGK